jgi:hypothetical protein
MAIEPARRTKAKWVLMSFMEWMLWFLVATFYVFCVFTVCLLTFRKGYVGLGILGIFVPFVWLVGAVLPAKTGSSYAREVGAPPARA